MIISTDAEKRQNSAPFMIVNPNKSEIKGNLLNLIKSIYEKNPIVNMTMVKD